MFNFFSDIAARTGLPFEILNDGFKVINFCNKSVYVEGFMNIVSFENTEISVKLKKGIVKVEGKNLKIKNMNLETLVILGEITKMEIC